jgi:hypothetical protein
MARDRGCPGRYTLYVRGEKKSEREEKQKNYHLIERSFGSFARSVELPDGVKPGDITAEIAKGVLKVTVKTSVPVDQANRDQDGRVRSPGVAPERAEPLRRVAWVTFRRVARPVFHGVLCGRHTDPANC